MSMSSGGAVLVLAFVPVLWAAMRLRRRLAAAGASQRPLVLAAVASVAMLAMGAGVAVTNGAFG